MKFRYLLRAVKNHNFSLQNYCKNSSEVDIVIPNRIHRGPTDILKALSSTVKRDPTAPHYKFHDDPYLIPYSNFTKRSYALSQESGRKAARWIRQEHADLFQHKTADPLIEAYLPKVDYNEESEVDEKNLNTVIDSGLLSDAVLIYNLLKNKEIAVTCETKQKLLELLCYFNEKEPMSEEWLEERWHGMGLKQENYSKSWIEGRLAEQLFNELKSDSKASYSAIICGMCKYNAVDKGYLLYNEARENNIPLDINAYNTLISKTKLLNENNNNVWELVQILLKDMANDKIKPNIKTLNAVLETLSKMNNVWNSSVYALQTIAEFKALNIEPCLTTFYYLLEIFYRKKEQLSSVFSNVINHIKYRDYTITDSKDILFFSRAMEIISTQLNDKDLAYRLHEVLLSGNNYNLIGDSFKESLYYRYFFFILTKSEELSKTMEFYDDLVPNVYVPEPAVMNSILKMVNENMAWDLLPKLWSDIVLFDQAEISGVVENILDCVSQNTDESLQEQMSKIAWSSWQRIEGNKRERFQFLWSASALGNIILTLLKSGNKAKAHLVMDKLVRLGSTIMNEAKVEALSLYIDSCIEENSTDIAIKCIQYCNDVGFMESAEFAKRLNSSLDLSPQHLQKLVAIVGEDCLKKEMKKETSS